MNIYNYHRSIKSNGTEMKRKQCCNFFFYFRDLKYVVIAKYVACEASCRACFWWQLWLPALPFACLCLVLLALVYTRSPLVSQILGNAQLLCDIAKQKAGSVPPSSVYSIGGIFYWFLNACNIILNTCSCKQKCACLCAVNGCRYICQCAHLLLCDQFSWTTKLVQLC